MRSLLSSVIFIIQRYCIGAICSEWAVNMHRDSYASYLGHNGLLAYFGTVENESIGRVKFKFMQVNGQSVATRAKVCA